MDVAVSILTVDYTEVGSRLKPILEKTDYVHLDVMDGVFVPNISFGYSFIKSLRKLTTKPFDTHLMIINPIKYIKQFAEAGSDYITFHLESASDPYETIKEIKKYGVKAGISIKPNTKVEEIEEFLPLLDMVLVMSVEPGFGGQSFMASSIDKVQKLASLKKEHNYHYLINIDGGINDLTAPRIKDYVDLAVSGSYIVNNKEPLKSIELLKSL